MFLGLHNLLFRRQCKRKRPGIIPGRSLFVIGGSSELRRFLNQFADRPDVVLQASRHRRGLFEGHVLPGEIVVGEPQRQHRRMVFLRPISTDTRRNFLQTQRGNELRFRLDAASNTSDPSTENPFGCAAQCHFEMLAIQRHNIRWVIAGSASTGTLRINLPLAWNCL